MTLRYDNDTGECDEVSFDVIGIPAPKGSKKGFVIKGRAVLVEQSDKAKPWEQAVHWTAREAMKDVLPFLGPVQISLSLIMPRPKYLKKMIYVLHDKKPDLDKLTRCILDGLTGVVYVDDGQVCAIQVQKRYANPDEATGAYMKIRKVKDIHDQCDW